MYPPQQGGPYPPPPGQYPPQQPPSQPYGYQQYAAAPPQQGQYAAPMQPGPYGPPSNSGQPYGPPSNSGPPPEMGPSSMGAGPPPPQFNTMTGGFSPFNLMTGGLLQNGQQWGTQYVQQVQQKVGWFTGSYLNAYFNISKSYVQTKLFMLLAPFLKRWTYTRSLEQISGGQKYRPPCVDANAPDLYIPLMAVWSYAMVACVIKAAHHSFKPDYFYSIMWSACTAWLVHMLVVKLLMRAMSVPGIPWVDLAAYTGYAYVQGCIVVGLGYLAGSKGFYAVWLYSSICNATFLVRTMKRIIFQEAKQYGADLTVTNYLLLALGAFQFPFAFWCSIRL